LNYLFISKIIIFLHDFKFILKEHLIVFIKEIENILIFSLFLLIVLSNERKTLLFVFIKTMIYPIIIITPLV